MPYEATYPDVPPIKRSALCTFAWALLFFALINITVWFVFDHHFFGWIGFERLLNDPSENQLRGMIAKIQSDSDHRHIILVGDSTLWGVPLDYRQTVAGIVARRLQSDPSLRVVNLAVPGASFADEYAIIDHLYKPTDTYLFFVNPIWFQDRYSALPFASLVRFPDTVAESLYGDRALLARCCDLQIPSPDSPDVIVRRLLPRMFPLVENQDIINATLLGMHPAAAETVVLSRAAKIIAGEKTTGSVEDIQNTANPNGKGAIPANDVPRGRNFALLRVLRARIGGRTNVRFILLDDDLYFRSPKDTENMNAVAHMLGSGTLLNLQNTIDHSLFSGITHLLPAAQARVADAIIRSLHAP